MTIVFTTVAAFSVYGITQTDNIGKVEGLQEKIGALYIEWEEKLYGKIMGMELKLHIILNRVVQIIQWKYFLIVLEKMSMHLV